MSLHWQEEWKVARNERERKVANRGRLVLEDLAPGTYQVERRKALEVVGDSSGLPRLEPLTVVVESGKTSEAALVRETGAAVEGEIIGLEKLKLPGALIYVVKPELLEFISAQPTVENAVEALTCDATGRFKTPRLPPGTYSIVVEGYKLGISKFRFGSTWADAYRVFGHLDRARTRPRGEGPDRDAVFHRTMIQRPVSARRARNEPRSGATD